MKTKRKRSYLIVLYFAISLFYLSLYADTTVKDIEYLKGGDFVQLYFKINKMISIPDVFYPVKDDNTRIIMRISDVTFEPEKKLFTFDSSVIDTIRIDSNSNSYVDVEIRLKAQVNYRVFTNRKGLYIEFPNIKKIAGNKINNGRKNKKTGKIDKIDVKDINANVNPNVNKVTLNRGSRQTAAPVPSAPSPSASASGNTIRDIVLREKDRDHIKFEIITTHKANFNVIPIPETPVRLAIDFKNTRSKRINRLVNHPNVKKIRGAYNAPAIFRVVFDLNRLKNYRVSPKKVKGNKNVLEVEFFSKKKNIAKVKKQDNKKKMMAGGSRVKPGPKVETKPVKPVLVANVPPTIINENADENESEAAIEPAKTFTIDNSNAGDDFFENEKSNVSAQDLDTQGSAGQTADPDASPLNGTSALDQTIRGGKKRYTGKPYGFNFHSADLKDVINIIAKISGLNIVMDPGISGKVTAQLDQVPWDQALELFLKINDLDMVREGNILRIGRVDKLATEAQKRRRLKEAQQMEEDLEVLTRHLSFARVEEVAALLRGQLSKRGEIMQDVRTNTLIISDIPEKINDIKRLIKTLDTPPLQVSIEARIVETNINYVENFGIQWGYNFVADAAHGNQTTLKFPSNIAVQGNQLQSQGSPFVGPLGGYAVNLPAGGANSGSLFSLGNVSNTFRLDMALSAMESKGKGRVISAPKTTTQNNMEASITQGKQIPVQTIQNNTISVVYRVAALELKVTPQITPDGHIITKLSIDNNSADFGNLVNDIPPITTQSIKTSVMIPDGGTIVIGGMYKIEKSTTKAGVPLLSKIPLLGSLFRNSAKRREQKELLIFVTPRIIK